MQRYFIDNKYFDDNKIVISNNDFHHMKNVMRFKINDLVTVANNLGNVYLTKIIEILKDKILLEIKEEIKSTNNTLNLTIAQSLIRKDNFELVLQKTTELGVKGIIPLSAKRSIIRIKDFSKKKERYNTIVKEASEQSERLYLPIIYDLSNLKTIQYNKFDLVLVAYARNDYHNNINCYFKQIKKSDNILVLIGPEGGFAQDEIDYLKIKAKFISLGNTILRSETAAIYVASIFRNYGELI